MASSVQPLVCAAAHARATATGSASATVRTMTLHHVRRGSGRPLLLVHGLGAGWRSWSPILDALAERREVIAIDLPGFGQSPPSTGEVSISSLTDAVADFIHEQGLDGVATVGQSMGGRIVLELARRGVGGDAVALDPGGFWSDRELIYFAATLRPSIVAVRALRGMLPALLGNPAGRTLLLAQLSARPWALSREAVLPDVRGLADSPATGAAMDALTDGPKQAGAPAGTAPGRITIGWGRRDLVTLPRQAARATELFPDAVLHWFERCGHFPQWDAPQAAIRLILDSTD